MKMSVKEFSLFTGVSVRTLHYYDEINLLKPDFTDSENGYRYYSDKATERMVEILFLKELDFPLSKISEILSSPDYDKKEAFRKQKKLLTLKKERLERLITALETAEKGATLMKKFDNSEFDKAKEKYADEVKSRWGNTEAYKESEEKASKMTKSEKQSALDGMEFIMEEFSVSLKKGFSPEGENTQALCKKLQQFITDNFYTCTKEILAGLGEMYVLDERFKANIDKNGEGTAEFIRDALRIYCK